MNGHMANPHDPLDSGDAIVRAGVRFSQNLAAGLLLEWLLTDIELIRPDYFANLESRFQSAFDYIPLFEAEGVFDGWVPVHTDDYKDVDFWIEADNLRLLLGSLFPYGKEDAPALSEARALVVVMLHSALESLLRDLDIRQESGESAVGAIGRLLALESNDPDLWADLVDLRETRNLIAHNSGVVNQRYRRHVTTALEEGEKRKLSSADISRFSKSIRVTADRLMRSGG